MSPNQQGMRCSGLEGLKEKGGAQWRFRVDAETLTGSLSVFLLGMSESWHCSWAALSVAFSHPFQGCLPFSFSPAADW